MRRHRVLVLLLSALAMPASAQAQRALDRADSLLNAGRYPEARAAVQEWNRANPPGTSAEPAHRARAIYLTARLTDNAAQAQEMYVMIALSYPTAREAPDALLRLGQGLLASNEPRRAMAYLERLVSDYPTAASRPVAHVWLARAQIASGAPSAACVTAGSALKAGGLPDDVAALLEAEEKIACASVGGPPPVTRERADTAPPPVRRQPPPTPRIDTIPPQDAPPRRDTASTRTPPRDTVSRAPAPQPVTRSSSDATGRYALQTGAFRNTQSATNIANALRRAGYDARVAYLEGRDLAHVRIGRFGTRAEAAALIARLKEAGYTAIIVDDVTRERK